MQGVPIEATVQFSLTLLDLFASQHSLLIFTPVYDGDYRIDTGELREQARQRDGSLGTRNVGRGF